AGCCRAICHQAFTLHQSQDENYLNGTMIRYSVRIAAESGREPPQCEANRCRTLDSGKRLAAPGLRFHPYPPLLHSWPSTSLLTSTIHYSVCLRELLAKIGVV